MNEVLPVDNTIDIEGRYEYVDGNCVFCKKDNRWHRTEVHSDSPQFIDAYAYCNFCQKMLRFTGDIINWDFEQLIWDAESFVDQKRHIASIGTLCQAAEMFMYRILQHMLIDSHWDFYEHDLATLNAHHEAFWNKVSNWTFSKWRNALTNFLHHRSMGQRILNTNDIIEAINRLDPTTCLKMKDIETIGSRPLGLLLKEWNELKVNQLRNNALHHKGALPSEGDCRDNIVSVRRITAGLRHELNMRLAPHP